MTTAIKAIYEDGVFKPTRAVELEEKTEVEVLLPDAEAKTRPTPAEAWAAAERFIGFIKDAHEGEPIAEEHDKYLHKSLAK